MSDFYRTEDIHQKLGTRLEELASSVSKPIGYCDTHVKPVTPQTAGLFGLAYASQPSVVAKMEQNLARAKTVLSGVSTLANDTESKYDATTDDALVKVDTIHDGLGANADPGTSVSDGKTTTSFGTGTADGKLTTPEEADELNWFVQQLIGLGGDLLSPSAWFNTLIGWMTGTEPISWVTQQFMGDYQAIHTCGSATQKIGDWYGETGSLISADVSVLFREWRGDAADSSKNYFRELIEAFADQPEALNSLGSDLMQSAQSMYFAGQAVTGLIIALIDLVIALIPLAIAAAAASTTGIGAIAWGPVISGVWTGTAIWEQALLVPGLAVSGAYLIAGVLGANLSMVNRMEQLDMPASA